MRKIPTVFRRDPDDMRRVLPEVTPGCEWVLAGEGVATRKYDGTCVMLDDHDAWWARREVRPGKPTPQVFVLVEADPATGKSVGWEPIGASPFAKWHAQALANDRHRAYARGTYELCGPKVNGNPERLPEHRLIAHDDAEVIVDFGRPPDFDLIRAVLHELDAQGVEGIVWHHPDGRMAKIKARDFLEERHA